MSPPMSADERKAFDERFAKIEHEVKASRAESRKSAEDGKFELERNIAAIAVSTVAAEARDAHLAKDLHGLTNRVKGIEIEQAKQGAELTLIGRQTKRLEGWMPVIKLVAQAVTAICAAYAAASAASSHAPEPAHDAAPMHP